MILLNSRRSPVVPEHRADLGQPACTGVLRNTAKRNRTQKVRENVVRGPAKIILQELNLSIKTVNYSCQFLDWTGRDLYG